MKICLYDGSVAEENTLQQFKEQQVGKRGTQWHSLVLFCGVYRIIKLKIKCFRLSLNHLSHAKITGLE